MNTFLPKINIVKNIENNTSLNGDFLFESKNLIRNYDTNIFEKYNINDLTFPHFQKLINMVFTIIMNLFLKMLTLRVKNPKNLKKMKIYMLLTFTTKFFFASL